MPRRWQSPRDRPDGAGRCPTRIAPPSSASATAAPWWMRTPRPRACSRRMLEQIAVHHAEGGRIALAGKPRGGEFELPTPIAVEHRAVAIGKSSTDDRGRQRPVATRSRNRFGTTSMCAAGAGCSRLALEDVDVDAGVGRGKCDCKTGQSGTDHADVANRAHGFRPPAQGFGDFWRKLAHRLAPGHSSSPCLLWKSGKREVTETEAL